MSKKDIDFGLKDIEINDYKLKKNNTGKIVFIIILIISSYLIYNFSDKLLLLNESFIAQNENELYIDSDVSVDNSVLFSNDSSLEKDHEKQFLREITNDLDDVSPKMKDINFLTGKYYIISGSFSNYDLSLNRANFLNDNAFNALIILPVNQNKMYRVAVDVYDDIDEAKENLKSYKKKLNNELWILKHWYYNF